MSGLYHTLGIGSEALSTTRQGVDTAGHNIANAQTEGFSRQRIQVRQRTPSERRGVIIGNGVHVGSITRAHDKLLEQQVNQLKQQTGYTSTLYDQLHSLEGIYSPELQSSVADEVTGFFLALQDMSNFPEELTVRTNVVESAKNMIAAFSRVDKQLRQQQNDLNDRIAGEAQEVNRLLTQIADFNIRIHNLETGQDKMANDLRDAQDNLLRELNTKIRINYYTGDGGMVVVRGPKEVLLVEKGHSSQVNTTMSEKGNNLYDISISPVGAENTGHFIEIGQANRTGILGALFKTRDEDITRLLEKNNAMAKTIATEFNAVHREGYGLGEYEELTGRDFFALSEDEGFSARTISLSSFVEQDTNAISAAITPRSPGDNVNINRLLQLETKKMMPGDATLSEYYANYVGVLGLDVLKADHLKEADEILMTDLNNRREEVAGVSLDEESINLLKWQANFTASSKLITTIDEMLETVLTLKR